jgi:D-alanine-D-alanine ligase
VNTNIVNLPHTRPLIARHNHNGGKLPKKVAILYSDAKRKYFSTYEEYLTEKGAKEEAESFIPYLNKLGIKGCVIAGNADMTKHLRREKPDMVINTCATVKGYDYLGATVPSTLELLEIPYTGASILGFALGCNKYLIHALLSQHGVPVPRFQLLTSTTTPIDPSLRYPLILKLNEEHSNVEIKLESVVENELQLRKRLRYLMKTYDQDVLLSEFIEGREFALFVFQSQNRKVYATERLIKLPDSDPRFQFMDYKLVWQTYGKEYEDRLKHTKYHDPLLESYAKKAYTITNMGSYGKFDVRMDKLGNYYFIDANANCHFGPPESYAELALTMAMYGVNFQEVLKRLLQNTMREWGY